MEWEVLPVCPQLAQILHTYVFIYERLWCGPLNQAVSVCR